MHIIRNKIKQNFQISLYIYIYNVAHHHHQNIINILKRFNNYKAKNKKKIRIFESLKKIFMFQIIDNNFILYNDHTQTVKFYCKLQLFSLFALLKQFEKNLVLRIPNK